MAHSNQTGSDPLLSNDNTPAEPLADARYTVFVEAGRHAGAVERLPEGRYRIGSSLDADLRLTDKGVAASHVMLDFTHGMARLEPLAAVIAVNGRSLAPGEFFRCRLPCVLEVGDARLSLRRPTHQGRRVPSWMLITGATALLTMVIGYGIASIETPSRVATTTAASTGPGPHGGAAPAAAATDAAVMPLPSSAAIAAKPADAGGVAAPSTTDPQAALQQRLAAEQLEQLTLSGDNSRLIVSGALPAELMPRWRDTQMWFDQTFGGVAVLTSRVRAARPAERPGLSVEAVYAGGDGYVVIGGERYPVGATVARRWLVASIDANRVVLKDSDGERITIDLVAQPATSTTGSRP